VSIGHSVTLSVNETVSFVFSIKVMPPLEIYPLRVTHSLGANPTTREFTSTTAANSKFIGLAPAASQHIRVARWFIFKPKIPIWENF
jgi:hypothetical protein